MWILFVKLWMLVNASFLLVGRVMRLSSVRSDVDVDFSSVLADEVDPVKGARTC